MYHCRHRRRHGLGLHSKADAEEVKVGLVLKLEGVRRVGVSTPATQCCDSAKAAQEKKNSTESKE